MLSIQAIDFTFLGLKLTEPNVFITDMILGILTIIFSRRIRSGHHDHAFFRNWIRFLWIFGIGMILGGLGHLLFNYTGIIGKTPAWILGIVCVYFIEQSMISIYPGRNGSVLLSRLSFGKLLVVLLLFLYIQLFAPFTEKIPMSMVLVIINTVTGVLLSTGLLSFYYYRKDFSSHFRLMVFGVLIMLPSAAVHLLEIHPARWFDKNDLNHLILGAGISFFYVSLLRLGRQENFVKDVLNS